jgi:putative addiction module component (TIGR02574 family)
LQCGCKKLNLYQTEIVMTAISIRQKLYDYIRVAEDRKVKAIYTILEEEINESTTEYSDELKAELDKRYAGYKSGKSKMVTAEESKKRINKILKTSRSK